MAHLKILPVILLNLIYLVTVNSLDICGAEDVKKCPTGDDECVTKNIAPHFLKLVASGQPAYFVDPVDPLHFETLPLETCKGLYTLKNVTVTGFSDGHFTYFGLDTTKKHVMEFILILNLKLTADDLVDANDRCVLDEKPLALRLVNIQADTRVSIGLVQRCKEQHFSFKKVDVQVAEIDYCKNVAVEHGLSKPDPEIFTVLAKTVVEQTCEKFASAVKGLHKIVPISAYWYT